VLELPEVSLQARPPDGSELHLASFVTSLSTCLLCGSAGGGWFEDQAGVAMLQPVPESRLHGRAAEANLGRASSGNSVVALRHAALISELLAGKMPPGSNPLNRRIAFSFPPAEAEQTSENALPLIRVPQRPPSPEAPPPWPQFTAQAAADVAPGWADFPQEPNVQKDGGRRPATAEVAAAKSLRLETLVTNRAAASEKCAASARQWREAVAADEQELEDKREPKGSSQSLLKRGFQALLDFLDFTNRRFGNPVRTWFILDPEANMKIGMRQFERKCMEIGFRGNIPALWKYADKSGDGIISLLELDTTSAMELAKFKVLIRERFRDVVPEAFRFLDTNRSGRVNKVTFIAKMQGLRYNGRAARLFDLLDRQGLGMLTVGQIMFLDIWRMPAYIYQQPDFKMLKNIRNNLLEVHEHHLRAWRHIDKDGTMRLSYEEFRGACNDILIFFAGGNKRGQSQPLSKEALLGVAHARGLPRNEAEVAAAWRVMDKDCAGFIYLRNWDMESHQHLSKFKLWCDKVHGGMVNAFRVLDGSGSGASSNAKLSATELKRCAVGPDGCKADLQFLFDGLDVANALSLSENDVKFLDTWDLAWEEWVEEASIKRQRHMGTGLQPTMASNMERSLEQSLSGKLRQSTLHT